MFRFLKQNLILLIILSMVLSLIPILSGYSKYLTHSINSNDVFNQELRALNSTEKLNSAIEKSYSKHFSNQFDTASYTLFCSEMIKNRFSHGPLDYSFSENWIAKLSGLLLWSHLSSIIIPDDILKHSYGLCSQQTIVFMNLLRQRNINVRSVGLGVKEGPGHFLCEVRYNNDWHLYDVSVEPNWSNIKEKHFSLAYYLERKEDFFNVYQGKLSKDIFEKIIKTVKYGEINAQPGSRMILFHKLTKSIVYLLPLCLSFLLFALLKKRKKSLVLKTEIRNNSKEPVLNEAMK